MTGLSAFAFIFLFLCILTLVLVIIREKRFCGVVLFFAIITIAVTATAGTLAVDSAKGNETVVTNVTFKSRYGFHRKGATFFIRFPDEDGNIYWAFGGAEDLALSETIPTPVRITYLSNTRYVLRIEQYVGDIPKNLDHLLPYHTDNHSDYYEIYTHRDSWLIACIFATIFIFIILAQEDKKHELPCRTKTPLSSKKRMGKRP